MTDLMNTPEKHRLAVRNWLFFSAAMIFIMAIIGAITRLTESGLSMVEWRPLIGAIPPLSEAEWQRVFDLYRETPEYIHKNAGMNMDAFKEIFFWEWFHRVWGRLIGLIYALPLFFFLIRGWIPKAKKAILIGLLFLGGIQGGIGWFMVMSGLSEEPDVSHYRLALHLCLAFVLYALIFWQGLQFHTPSKDKPVIGRDPIIWASYITVTVTIIYGVFVAGMDAGMIYNEWPLMGSSIMPSDMWFLDPWWMNIFENKAGVQFIHRWLAVITLFSIILLWARYSHKNQPDNIRKIAWWILALTIAQVALGIATLITQLYIPLAAAHQGGALLVLSAMLILSDRLGRLVA